MLLCHVLVDVWCCTFNMIQTISNILKHNHVELRDEQIRLEALHLEEAKEKKTEANPNRSNLKCRKNTSGSSSISKRSTTNVQIVQPMQMDNNYSNTSSHSVPLVVRSNNTTKLRSIAAHNIRNNISNATTSTSAGSSATGKMFCFHSDKIHTKYHR